VSKIAAILLAFSLGLTACGTDGPETPENYGNLLDSPGGLLVLQEEHPDGWGRPDCLVCHVASNMHTVNRTGLPDAQIDLPGVRAIVQAQGQASCSQCHGDNGVMQ
jgi:hypothetical protein